MAVIYAVYYDDRHIPRFIAAIRSRRLLLQPADVNFARFDNRSSLIRGEDTDSVAEVDLHFGTDQSIENLNSAFNNPMFDQNIDVPSSRRSEELKAD